MEAASIAGAHAAGAHDDHHHGPPEANRSSRVEPQLLGMLLFIISEIMVFGAFFTAYFFIRVVQGAEWPADGTELPITTESLYRYGDSPGGSTAKKIGGGAAAGAILGVILGGAKGAAIGATTGAGAGTAIVVAGDRSEAVFAAGTEVTARILSPVTVTVER